MVAANPSPQSGSCRGIFFWGRFRQREVHPSRLITREQLDRCVLRAVSAQAKTLGLYRASFERIRRS